MSVMIVTAEVIQSTAFLVLHTEQVTARRVLNAEAFNSLGQELVQLNHDVFNAQYDDWQQEPYKYKHQSGATTTATTEINGRTVYRPQTIRHAECFMYQCREDGFIDHPLFKRVEEAVSEAIKQSWFITPVCQSAGWGDSKPAKEFPYMRREKLKALAHLAGVQPDQLMREIQRLSA